MFVCPDCGSRSGAAGFCTEHGRQLRAAGDDPLLGSMVGSYRIADTIGEGGMGRVYKAVQPNIGSRVAIKVLSAECSSNPTLVDRFFAEARAVNLIRHEGLVGVLDLATLPDKRPFIVMEHLEGAPLSALIRSRGALPLGTLVTLLGEVLDALAAAHEMGIVHRDLKPDNLFVTSGGRIKLLDFGVAKLRPELGGVGDATRTGSLLGTPHYMSPEQAQGLAVDHRADLYALGVMLFEGATGQRPYPNATSLYELLKAHVELMPPQPSLLRPEVPPALEQVMLRALQKNPAQRFQSAGELAQALGQAARALPPESFVPLATLLGGVLAVPLRTPPVRSPLPSTPAALPANDTLATYASGHARAGMSAGTMAMLVLLFLAIAFVGSCLSCSMCVAGV
jgi:eukaryotic-like serine/threonine-protein kinase